MLARDNENFRTPGENWTHDPPNTTCLSDVPTTEPEGREFDSCQGHGNFLCPGRAWFLTPSKLKMFTGNVCVLLTSVSLNISFRGPAEKKNKQQQTNKHSSVTI